MKTPNPMPGPAAACPRCGGWTNYGGCSQFYKSLTFVNGRTGCFCHKSVSEKNAVLSLVARA